MFTSIIARLTGKRIVEKDGRFIPQVIFDSEWHAVPRESCYGHKRGDNVYGLVKCGTLDEPKNWGDVNQYCTVESIEKASESYIRYLDYLEARKPVPPKVHKMPKPEPLAWRRLKEK